MFVSRKFCPFAGCPHHKKADKAPGICGSVLRKHLNDAHKNELSQFKNAVLVNSELFLCRQCEECGETSEGQLKAHIEKCHVDK